MFSGLTFICYSFFMFLGKIKPKVANCWVWPCVDALVVFALTVPYLELLDLKDSQTLTEGTLAYPVQKALLRHHGDAETDLPRWMYFKYHTFGYVGITSFSKLVFKAVHRMTEQSIFLIVLYSDAALTFLLALLRN